MTERFVFGQVEVEPGERVVRIAGSQVPIGARAFDVLLALIERRNRVVTKNELLDTVWPGTVVEESNVVVQVSSLRKLLGDKFIATIPGRGYRLIAAATAAPTTAAAAPPAPAEPAAAAPLSPSLLGRTAELTELSQAMERSRLVTIIGAGGVGKTRLAQACAARHSAGWADLGALSDAELVAGTVARALGLPGAMGDALEGLRRGSHPSVDLLVLDNAEHLVEEVARVVCVLLEHAPGLKILVTSQVPLGLEPENLLRLAPLAVPPSGTDVAMALTHGAVALFSERVRACDRHFLLDEQNIDHAIGICRRLDGIPLAIELAAARMPMLGMAELEKALDERLRLLTRGPRNLPPRQQTLLATLDWSHALLDATEQSVFRRLGVFAGSFSLEMARRILSGSEPDDLDEWQVTDAMGMLIDRSLLTVNDGETTRYAMLDTMRTYALSKLASAGEASRFCARHAHACLDLFDRVDQDHWHGRVTAGEAMAVLADEVDNAVEALRFAIDHEPDVAVALVPGLSFGLRRRGGVETARILDATAKCINPDTPTRLRAAWLVEAARFWAGRKPEASAEWGMEAAALYTTLDDRLGLYRALIAITISDFNSVSEIQRRALHQAGTLRESTWPVRPSLIGAWAQARVSRIDGRHEDALESLREVISLAKLNDDIALLAFARMEAAELELLMGRPAAAADEANHLAEWMHRAQAPAGLPATLRIVSAAELALGRTGPARKAAKAGWSLATRFGDQAGWMEVVALLAVMENRGEDAALLIGACDEQASNRRGKQDPIAAAALVKAERLLHETWGIESLQPWRQKGRYASQEHLTSVAFSTPGTKAGAPPA